MKTTMMLMITILVLGITAPAMCNWELMFGKEASQLGFVNPPPGPEDPPLGPASFRLVEGNIWVLDSVKGQVLCFNPENKLTANVKIPGLPKQFYLDDFAIQLKDGKPVSIWVAERFSNEIIKVSMNGKELARTKTGQAQLDQLEVDSTGQLYVGDFGKSELAVYSSEGKKLRKMPWQLSGFAVDASDNLHMINFNDGTGHQHVILSPDGKELSRTEIGFANMQNPRLWHVTANNDILVSFIPESGDPTKNILVKISAKGLIEKKLGFTNPYYINRYLLLDDKSCWLANADYLKAPEQTIKISRLGEL
ncbi:MAG: hypothetical protein Kow0029_24930 [Candidatus Rifleibacteriota bacterium]